MLQISGVLEVERGEVILPWPMPGRSRSSAFENDFRSSGRLICKTFLLRLPSRLSTQILKRMKILCDGVH